MNAIRVEGTPQIMSCSDGRLTLHVPIRIRRCSGCKKITLPDGETGLPHKPTRSTAMQPALAGHAGIREVKILRELAVREGVDNSYVSRMINLTMLSPYVVAAILDDTLPDNITLLELATDPPLVWA